MKGTPNEIHQQSETVDSISKCLSKCYTRDLVKIKYPGEMMKASFLMVGLMATVFGASAMANADLAKAKNCMTCHAVATKLVGPAFKDVAAKYAGQKDAEAKLATKVIKGGSGTWGAVPMPANSQVSQAEAQTLVKWVLSQK